MCVMNDGHNNTTCAQYSWMYFAEFRDYILHLFYF